MHIERDRGSMADWRADPASVFGKQGVSPHACRVLVVDDDSLTRSRLAALLSASRYEVEVAGTGAEALRVLDMTQCDVVLTDWKMPVMDGLALCRHIRLRVPATYTYVIMLTIRNTEDDMLTGFAAGADDYVVKGATISEILARIETGRRVCCLSDNRITHNRGSRDMSFTDSASGAYNFAYLTQHLPRELARSQRYGRSLAVLNCTIEELELIDDRAASAMGDVLLRGFVNGTVTCVRNCDWLARTGDHDFMLILPETSAAGARRVEQKLQQLFALHPLATPAGPVTIPLGIESTCVDPRHNIDSTLQFRALLRGADRRRADNSGRGAPGVASEATTLPLQRAEDMTSTRAAIRRKPDRSLT
jgi:two-component system, cell cycle response regulator